MLCKLNNPILLLKCCAISSRTNETQLPTDSVLFLNFPPASKTVCPIPSPTGPVTWAYPELLHSFSHLQLPLPGAAGGHHQEHQVPGSELPWADWQVRTCVQTGQPAAALSSPDKIVCTCSPFLSVREWLQEPPLSFPNLGGPQCVWDHHLPGSCGWNWSVS